MTQMFTAKIDIPQTLSFENIQTSIRITRTSWLFVLFLNDWYLTYYVFQVKQCICHFTIRKPDAKRNLCLTEGLTMNSWVYKGTIHKDPIKEGEGHVGP